MRMLLRVKFEDPLTVNVNVTIVQKQDEKVVKLEKQMDSWLTQLAKSIKNIKTVSDRVDSTT